jgi:hypothetical protein
MKRIITTFCLILLITCLPLPSHSDAYEPGSVAVSLSAVAATGAGTVYASPVVQGKLADRFTWTTTFTGTPTAITVNLQGSIDGTNYFTLDTSTSTTAEMRHVVNKPVRFTRCQISVYTVNGSTATCSLVMTIS